MRVYWCLAAFYKYMQLTVYKNTPSRWVWNQLQTWEKQFMRVWGDTFIVLSTFTSSQTKHKMDVAFADRCLPHPSVSTLGAVVLLTRWAYLTREAGGVADERAHECAALMLQSCFDMAFPGSGKESALDIAVDDSGPHLGHDPPALRAPRCR